MIRNIFCCATTLVTLTYLTTLIAAESAHAIEIQRVKSPNGIEAWLVRDTSVPVLSVEFSFRGGRTYDPPGKAGLSYMLSGLLDEGAGVLDSKTFQAELEDKSIQMSFRAGRDTFRGSLKTLTKYRDRAVDLLSLALTEPRFDKEPVERIRQQAKMSLKRKAKNPDYVAARTWATAVFGNHPYAMSHLGREESLKAITRQDLVDVVKERFARNLLIVGVTGDITPIELELLLDRAFSRLPKQAHLPRILDVQPKLTGETYVIKLDVPQSAIRFGQLGLKRDDPDWYTSVVMNYVLGGGGFSSRLFSEIREKRGLAYSVGANLRPMRYSAVLSGHAGTKNENVADSLKIIRAEWNRMREDGVTTAELARAKSYLTGSFPLRLSSTDQIARMLVAIQYHDLGIDYIKKRSTYINAVTQEDIMKLAQRLLDPKKLTFVIVGKPEDVSATAPKPRI